MTVNDENRTPTPVKRSSKSSSSATTPKTSSTPRVRMQTTLTSFFGTPKEKSPATPAPTATSTTTTANAAEKKSTNTLQQKGSVTPSTRSSANTTTTTTTATTPHHHHHNNAASPFDSPAVRKSLGLHSHIGRIRQPDFTPKADTPKARIHEDDANNDEAKDDEDDDVIGTPSSRRRLRKRRAGFYREDDNDDDDDDDEKDRGKKVTPKRRKVTLSDDDDDDEDGAWKPDDAQLVDHDNDDDDDDVDDDVDIDDDAMDEDEPEPEDAYDTDEIISTPRSRKGRGATAAARSTQIPKTPRTPKQQSTTAGTTPTSSNNLARFALSPRTPTQMSSPFTTTTTTTKATSRTSSPTPPTPSRTAQFKEKNEQRYAWLLNPSDADGRPPTDPSYDPRTLFIPSHAWRTFTPFEKQFWEIKSKHWDTVVFFKKGKFYELYEKDADIGHQQFDLKLTDRVNMRMVGVPESSFEHWAAQFIAKGYKVARVDQAETAVGKAMREREAKEAGKKKGEDKIIRRELTCVLTAGTLVDTGLLTTDMATYCMALVERSFSASDAVVSTGAPIGSVPVFGVAFVDTSTSQFHISSFIDDPSLTKLETLLLQISPKEVILEKGKLSPLALKMLKAVARDVQITQLVAEREFWNGETLCDEIVASQYFGADNTDRSTWPAALATTATTATTAAADGAVSDADRPAITTAAAAMDALGGLVSYLRTLNLDLPTLACKSIQHYDPAHSTTLCLDAQSLLNLEIFQNAYDGSEEGTVFKLLSRGVVTPMGRRMMRRWVCHPLRDMSRIQDRLDAQAVLWDLRGECARVRKVLGAVGDVERGISRVKSGGGVRVKEFVGVLEGFRVVDEVFVGMESVLKGAGESERLAFLVKDGVGETLRGVLKWFEEAFDNEVAKRTGSIELRRGYDAYLDSTVDEMTRIENELEGLRQEYEQLLKCKTKYKDMGKELFTIEVPKNAVSRVPKSWKIRSQTAQCCRYWSEEVEGLVNEYVEARERKEGALREVKERLCKRFGEGWEAWRRVVERVGEIDCLMALVEWRRMWGDNDVCRPVFVKADKPTLVCKGVRHPCVSVRETGFVTNDVVLGTAAAAPGSKSTSSLATASESGDTAKEEKEARILLLTGPNMGGKSTLLRSTSLAILLAHLGTWTPCTSYTSTLFDRIFTRLGASDSMHTNQSTFHMELSETATILREATQWSWCIVDELGRGTSTWDGTAIAGAVLEELGRRGCLGVFATHYRGLVLGHHQHHQHQHQEPTRMVVDQSAGRGQTGIVCGYMSYLTGSTTEDPTQHHTTGGDTDNNDDDDATQSNKRAKPKERNVTFLYTLVPGISPASFGMNVACMAGVPLAVVESAERAAGRMENGDWSVKTNKVGGKSMVVRGWLEEGVGRVWKRVVGAAKRG
ncbi:DNA mismatch repair protein msh6 [Gaertneriomyces sp. JEL0708]|nr:DNA mismatch repair protein msh6 [Gaertneriomyces sp. JEL0708]